MALLAPWIVGIDLGPQSRGALVFAAWLGHTSGIPVIGLHVRETARSFTTGMDAESLARTAVEAQQTQFGLPPLDRVEIVTAARAEDGLTAAAEDAEGLVLGRTRAGDADDERLGRVTRRVLRTSAAPVVVVPANLTAVGDGPVLLATDLGPASSAAARWAASFAAEHGRGLEVVHVVRPREDPFAPPPEEDLEGARAAGAIAAWLAAHGVGDRPQHVPGGEPAAQIAEVAAGLRAVLVVTGSRRLAATERLFAASTSAALAGRCGCPVAVVPPR